MREDFQKIFDSLGKEEQKEPERQPGVNDNVLIVDSLNTFLRAFTVIRHTNRFGAHIGGLTGYLRSLGYVMNIVRPTRVILVFDGQGSSTNKRYIYPEYKGNRGIKRITNWDDFEDQEQESAAIRNQVVRLVYYLKCLPVDLVIIDKIEADDVIGHISQQMKDSKITIMSSDRDYLQLVSDRVSVYSPTKKKFYTPKVVKTEYGVTPQNFLTQKIVVGDFGDNVPGVKGIKEKTLIKNFPELCEESRFSLEELLEKSEKEEGKAYSSILAFRNQLFINRQLMDLENPNIPEESIEEIAHMIENPKKTFMPKEFQELYDQDDLGNSISNLQSWLYNHFHVLSKIK